MASTRFPKFPPFSLISSTRSVAASVAFVLVAITTLLMTVFLVYFYQSDKFQQWTALQKNVELTTDQAAAALYLPVWNIDSDQINKVIESVMKDNDIYGIVLRRTGGLTSRGDVIYGRMRDGQWKVVIAEREIPAKGMLVQQRSIVTEAGETIGTLTLYETPKFALMRLHADLLRMVLFMLLLNLALILSLYASLWLIVLRPLRAVEQYALTVNSGDTHAAVLGRFRGELESLRLSIQNMVSLLASRYASLQKQETMLAAVLNSVPQAIFWKDPNSVYLGCNEKFARAAGLASPALVIGKTDFEFPWKPDAAETFRARDREVAQGQVMKGVVEPHWQADGSRKWIDTTKLPLFDSNGMIYAILGVYHDVTELKLAEEALRRQANFDATAREVLGGLVGSPRADLDEHLRTSLRLIAQFMGARYAFMAQASSDASTWSYTHEWCDAGGESQLAKNQNIPVGSREGVEHALIAGEITQIRNIDDLPRDVPALRQSGESLGIAASIHVPLRGPGGRVHGCIGLVFSASSPPATPEDIQRITLLSDAIANALERMQAEKALRDSEERFRLLIEQSPVALAITRGAHFVYRNPAHLRMFGHPPEQANAARPILDVIALESRAGIQENIRRRAAGLPVVTPVETRGLRTDGTEFPFSYEVAQVDFVDGPVMISFITDLSERKRAEALVLESEKLRTVAGLAAGIAHEINNPLAAMVQNAQVAISRLNEDRPANRAAAQRQGIAFDALRRYVADREVPEMLEAIRASGRQASSIVQNLLTYSRRDTAKSAVDLAQLVDQTLELGASDYELRKHNALAAVEIERQYASEAVTANCHANQIQQVLLNLIRNAVQAMRANPPERRPVLRLRTFYQDGFACLAVEDNGPGIAPEIRGKMFEPFVTTKPEGQGTGLGLFVCYHIISVNHAGKIRMEPAPRQGTCCTIMLPKSALRRSQSGVEHPR